jgi:citrate lyase beta subunit
MRRIVARRSGPRDTCRATIREVTVTAVLRSLLFVPAGRERMLEHAQSARADALVLDLEEAVPAKQKAAARALAKRWIPQVAKRNRPVFVRLNGLRSGLTRDDLMAVAGKQLAGVVLPKTESPQDLRDLDVLLRESEMAAGVRPGDIRTIALIESARAVLRCEEIARATDRILGLSVGGEDYTRDIGAKRDAEGLALQHIRAVIVQVAAAYGLASIDTPYTAFDDDAGLAEDARVARAIGLQGKYAIHPAQAPIINKAFSPSKDEVAAAARIVDAFDGAKGGAISVDGRMVDAPIAERARAVIAASKRR